MGSVYEAVHVRLDNRVAIKLMSRDLTSNPEALARFRREAQVTSQLGHPNIVHVFDFGTAPTGEPFLAMELLDGEDLEQRLRRLGRLPVPAVVHIVKQVASALAATHAKDIVHRDLKPANVFLLTLEDGSAFVKVVDFGISKVRSAKARLTQARLVMGSPQFMAPEQALGRVDDIDHKSDQWALACMAFEALCGRTPFVGDDVNTLLYQVVHVPAPELRTLAPELPPALTTVFARALSKSPSDRYTSIAVFAKAFEDAAAIPATKYKPTLSYPASAEEDRTESDAQLAELALGTSDTMRQVNGTTLSRNAGELAGELTPPAVPMPERLVVRRSRTLAATVGGLIVLGGVVLGLGLRGPSGATDTPRAPAPALSASAPVPAAEPPTLIPIQRLPATPAPEPAPPPPAAAASKRPPAPPAAARPRRAPAPKPKRQLFEEL